MKYHCVYVLLRYNKIRKSYICRQIFCLETARWICLCKKRRVNENNFKEKNDVFCAIFSFRDFLDDDIAVHNWRKKRFQRTELMSMFHFMLHTRQKVLAVPSDFAKALKLLPTRTIIRRTFI